MSEKKKEKSDKGNYLADGDKIMEGCTVMISYSRKDKAFVKNIYDALAIDDRNIWVDWEDIPPSNDWLDEIHKGIEQSDCFIFVLSPDSIKSEVCNWEVDHAVKNGKRIIPVVCRDVDYREVRKELASLNWIFFRPDGDDFNAAMKLLLKALDNDLRHARYHTKLLTRAIDWERHDFEKSLLLTGQDLQRAKHWLSASALGKEPKPTTLHLSFITASDALATSMKKTQIDCRVLCLHCGYWHYLAVVGCILLFPRLLALFRILLFQLKHLPTSHLRSAARPLPKQNTIFQKATLPCTIFAAGSHRLQQ